VADVIGHGTPRPDARTRPDAEKWERIATEKVAQLLRVSRRLKVCSRIADPENAVEPVSAKGTFRAASRRTSEDVPASC
jgi:hypothetical protein